MAKTRELIGLWLYDGRWIATVLNKNTGHYDRENFILYDGKWDVIRTLRRRGVRCPRKAYE